MASPRFGRGPFCLGFSPLECIQIEFIKVIEGCSVVIDSSVTTEYNDFVFIRGHRVIGSWFRPSDLGHCIFRDPAGFLIGGLGPDKIGCIM